MSSPLRRLILTTLLTLTALPIAAQQASLKQRMGDAQFHAAGLDTLTAPQLASLQQWIDGHGEVKVIKQTVDTRGKPLFKGKEQPRESFETTIKGELTGWHKDQVFTLSNAQQWQVTDPNAKTCRPSTDAKVRIRPSLFGLWLMYVPSCYDNVHVKRVR